jgi:hypothetical protein
MPLPFHVVDDLSGADSSERVGTAGVRIAPPVTTSAQGRGRKTAGYRWSVWYNATIAGAGDTPRVAAKVFSQR